MNQGDNMPASRHLGQDLRDVQAIAFDVIDGTNAEAARRAEAGAGHLTLITARRQTLGRGRYQRRWESPAGNVHWSMILRPEPSWPSTATLSYVAALSVAETVADILGETVPVTLKWPNDVLVRGRKIAGILLEAGGPWTAPSGATAAPCPAWVIAGIGINVALHPETGMLYPATSLAVEGAQTIGADRVAARLTEHFVDTLSAWIEAGFAPLRARVLARLAGLGAAIRVQRSEGADDAVRGTFTGIDEAGNLLLREESGAIRTIAAGDVFFHTAKDL